MRGLGEREGDVDILATLHHEVGEVVGGGGLVGLDGERLLVVVLGCVGIGLRLLRACREGRSRERRWDELLTQVFQVAMAAWGLPCRTAARE